MIAASLAACGNSESSSVLDEPNAENYGIENFIQYDEKTGRAFIQNDDGTIEYLDDNSETDEEIEYFVGEYSKNGYKVNINDNWHAYEDGVDLHLSPIDASDEDSSLNFISITTFDNAGISDFSECSKDTLTNDFNSAVENEIYKDVELVESETVKVGGSDALYYKCLITTTDDLETTFTTYVINDKYGGHVIAASDKADDYNTQAELDYIIKNIEFVETDKI